MKYSRSLLGGILFKTRLHASFLELRTDLRLLELVHTLGCWCWQVADLSMGDLLLHNTVIWLNPPASLGKWKKEPELAAFGWYPRTFISHAFMHILNA